MQVEGCRDVNFVMQTSRVHVYLYNQLHCLLFRDLKETLCRIPRISRIVRKIKDVEAVDVSL